MLRAAVVPLRVVLVLTFALLVVGEVFAFPGMLAHWAEESADFADVRWFVLAVLEIAMLSVQVVIVRTWRLLTLVGEDRVFTRASVRWVDGIIAATVIGLAVLAGLAGAVVVSAGEPGNAVAMAMFVLPAAAFVLVLVVMRALLLQATQLRTDMAAVI